MQHFIFEYNTLLLPPILLNTSRVNLCQQGSEQRDTALALCCSQVVPMPPQTALRHILIRKTLRQHLLDLRPALRRSIRATQGRILKNGDQLVDGLAHLLRGRASCCDDDRAEQEHKTEQASCRM